VIENIISACKLKSAKSLSDHNGYCPLAIELIDAKPCDYFTDTVHAYCLRMLDHEKKLSPQVLVHTEHMILDCKSSSFLQANQAIHDIIKCMTQNMVPMVPKLDETSCEEIRFLIHQFRNTYFLLRIMLSIISICDRIASGQRSANIHLPFFRLLLRPFLELSATTNFLTMLLVIHVKFDFLFNSNPFYQTSHDTLELTLLPLLLHLSNLPNLTKFQTSYRNNK
jgi:hypothetical protein